MVELYFGQRVGYRVGAHPYFSGKFVLKGGWALTRYFTVLLSQKIQQKIQRGRERDLSFVGCVMSQQHARVISGMDLFSCTCSRTETKKKKKKNAGQMFYFTQSQYIDTVSTSPSADPMMPGAWQGSHWNTNFVSLWYDLTQTNHN